MPLIELTGHTDGPWFTENEESQVINEKGRIIVDFTPRAGDARLIAAAPSLLAIANELAEKLTLAGQPHQAAEAFISRGIAPPALVRREATGRDGE